MPQPQDHVSQNKNNSSCLAFLADLIVIARGQSLFRLSPTAPATPSVARTWVVGPLILVGGARRPLTPPSSSSTLEQRPRHHLIELKPGAAQLLKVDEHGQRGRLYVWLPVAVGVGGGCTGSWLDG